MKDSRSVLSISPSMPLNNMRRSSIATVAYVFLTGVAVLVGAVAPLFVTFAAESPRVFILDAELLKSAKDRLKTGDRSLQPALDKILRSADHALTLAPLSVT